VRYPIETIKIISQTITIVKTNPFGETVKPLYKGSTGLNFVIVYTQKIEILSA
jgi:hypothetical protein